MLLKSRCQQVLRHCICYHLVGSALHQLDDAIFDELVDEMLTRVNVSRPLSVTWVKYRSSLPASLAAYHSLSAVLRDTLFSFTDFQLIGPPFIIIT
jgi:hypothetical protein